MAHPIRLRASGGSHEGAYHDWLMSDGSVETLTTEQAGARTAARAAQDPFSAESVATVARLQREARALAAAKAARAGRLAAAYLRGHGDTCPSCHTVALLSDRAEGGLEFSEPLCAACRARYAYEAQLTDWDREYERARVNGWED